MNRTIAISKSIVVSPKVISRSYQVGFRCPLGRCIRRPGQKGFKRTTFALRGAAAIVIPCTHNQCMQFVVMPCQFAAPGAAHARCRVPGTRPSMSNCESVSAGVADRALDQCADLLITCFGGNHAVSLEYAAGVGVDNEDRMVAGVEQNGIGGFRSNAV